MRRHLSLQPLSDDHHRALVLARRLRRSSGGLDPGPLAALASDVQRRFETELEPHFHVEEQWLLPALEARGAEELVSRTVRDHVRLRELVRGPWSDDTPQTLGELLEKHVRFEERVLFPRAEALLSETELAAVRDAAAIQVEQRRTRR